MSTASLASLIGRTGLLRLPFGPLLVGVRVVDARSVYGRTDLRVTPLAGEGESWVAETRVTLAPTNDVHPPTRT